MSRLPQYLLIAFLILLAAGAWYRWQAKSATTINSSQTDRYKGSLTLIWTFDGADTSSTTATDRSGNALNGTLTDSPPVAAGRVGQALDFDGSADYVTIADNASLDFGDTADLSLSGWFYRDTSSTDDVIVAKRNGNAASDAGYVVYLDATNDKLRLEVSDGTDEYELASTSTFTSTGWYHFVAVWDQDSAANSELYINGVDDNATDTGTIGNVGDLGNALAFRAGAESDAGAPFDGKLDEIRVYSTALTSDQAAEIYRMGTSATINASQTDRYISSLTLNWTFDGADTSSTTATDRSGNSLNGTLTSSPPVAAGRVGQSLDFDGSADYVTIADNAALDFGDTADLSLSGWFYRDTSSSDDVIVAKRNGNAASDTGYVVYIDATNDKLRLEVSDGTDEYELASATAFTSTGWYHFVAVWDQDSAANSELYINGVDDNATDTGTIGNIGDLGNALAFRAGAESDDGAPFDGKLDEIRVYSTALTSDQAAEIYRMGTSLTVNALQWDRYTSGLIGMWTLDGGDFNSAGTTVTDRSPTGQNGTLSGSPVKVNGKVGQALDLVPASNNMVSAGSPATYDNLSAFSYVFWLYPHNEGENNNGFILAKNNGNCFAGVSLSFDGAGTNRLYFCVTYATNGMYRTSANNAVTLNQWNHVVVTWDGSSTTVAANAHIYVNGSEVSYLDAGTDGTGAREDESTRTLQFGRMGGATTRDYDGLMDEIRLYNRALSATEVAELYRMGQ